MANKQKKSRSVQVKKQAQKKKRQEKVKKLRLKQQSAGSKNISFSKLKKTTARMPELVFEPEIQQIEFDKAELLSLAQSDMSLPQQVIAFFNDSLVEQFIIALNQIADRRTAKTSSLNARAFLMMYKNGLPPVQGVNVFVAFYLMFRYSIAQLGEQITLENVHYVVDQYEKSHAAELEPVVSDYLNHQQKYAGQTTLTEQEELDGTELADAGKFVEYTDTHKGAMSELLQTVLDAQTATELNLLELEDDLEVFLTDYLGTQKVDDPANIQPTHFRQFITQWFYQNLNPTTDDLRKMKDHLQCLAAFLYDQKMIDEQAKTEIDSCLG